LPRATTSGFIASRDDETETEKQKRNEGLAFFPCMRTRASHREPFRDAIADGVRTALSSTHRHVDEESPGRSKVPHLRPRFTPMTPEGLAA
jgi:hypothetical protein